MNRFKRNKGIVAVFVYTLVIAIGMIILGGIALIIEQYTWDRDYYSFWALAEKSSSIPAKQEKLEQFYKVLVEGREKGAFATNNAVCLSTPNNSFESNLQALKTLVIRLEEISKMSVTSFEYQTAIQQITAQEQGEAHDMMRVFEGCYALHNYPTTWGWIGLVYCIIVVILGFLSLISGIVAYDDYY